MYSKNTLNRATKIISILVITLSFTFVIPQTTHAQYIDPVEALKETLGDGYAYYLTNKILDKMTASTVNWINSGFKGNPTYVQNPKNFFLSMGDNEVSKFLSDTSLNNLCTAFKPQVRLALVKNYLSETDNQAFSCSLSKIKDNYEGFMKDFKQGGWEGWLEITQNDNNNPYGAYMSAKLELDARVSQQQDTGNKEIDLGKGFLSMKKCPEGKKYTQADIDWLYDNSQGTGGEKVGDCKVPEETVTPGSVIQDQLNKTLANGTDRLKMADEIDEIIGALLEQLINHVIGGIGNGLKGLSERSGTGSTYTTSLTNDPTPYNPSMPYDGNTSSGPGTVDPDAEPASLLDDVIAARSKRGETVSKAEITEILSEVATKNTANGWGLLSKSAGNNCPSAKGPVACDILFHKPSCLIYDVLGSADDNGPATPQWIFAGSASRDKFTDIGNGGGGDTSNECVPVTPPNNGIPTPPIGGNPNDQTEHKTPTEGIKPDLSNVTIVGGGVPTDVGSWRVTSNIEEIGFTPTSDGSTLHFKHTKNGVWTPINFDGALQEGTLWLFFYVNGKWYTTGSERLRPNQINKPETAPSRISTDLFYNNSWAPMGGESGYSPRVGEYVGFMVTSGNTRVANNAVEHERSNVVLIKWPSDSATVSFPPFSNI